MATETEPGGDGGSRFLDWTKPMWVGYVFFFLLGMLMGADVYAKGGVDAVGAFLGNMVIAAVYVMILKALKEAVVWVVRLLRPG